jgi:hypothetical protein
MNEPKHSNENPRPGFFAARPWIWVVVGYAFFVGVMLTYVWIASTHAQPSVPVHPAVHSTTQHP